MSEPRAVGIWVRVSSDDQARGDSPELHERRARAYAESRGWFVREVYLLPGVSGKSVRGQPECKRMVADLERGHISALIFSKLARLARNLRELLDFSDLFRAKGADLISLEETFDTSTPAGRLFYMFVGAMAQWEREEIAARVASAIKMRAKMGRLLVGRPVFGYRREGQRLVPDEKEAPIRRLMYDLFLQHRRQKTVARLLNEAGHRTRKGKPFTGIAVQRLLEDPTAKGRKRTNWTSNQNHRVHRKPESEWVYIDVEPIVSEETWAQVEGILAERRTGKRPPPGPRPVQLFVGLAFCACGGRLYVPSSNPKYVCHECRNKIPIGDLETVYFNQVRQFLLSPSAIADLLRHADEDLVGRQQLIASLEAERRKIQAETDSLYQLHHAGEVPTLGFGRRLQPLDDRRTQIDLELPRLQGELDALRVQVLNQEDALTEAKRIGTSLENLDRQEKRVLIEALTDRIVVGKGEVEVHLRYFPTRAAASAAPSDPAEHASQRPRIGRCGSRPRGP